MEEEVQGSWSVNSSCFLLLSEQLHMAHERMPGWVCYGVCVSFSIKFFYPDVLQCFNEVHLEKNKLKNRKSEFTQATVLISEITAV
ncbi:hypothetical protein NQZ68_034446 [Dissostichus eleginoides]|nr:hypothetical protein NQZ68_034446 [Dissostichus eleginoides]